MKVTDAQSRVENGGGDIYRSLLIQHSPFVETITRDLHHTFPRSPMFRDKDGYGQRAICNVLVAFSVYDTQVGYCQGMGFLAALFLSLVDEVSAFWLLVTVMEASRYGLRGQYLNGMPGLQICFHQFQSLLQRHLLRLQVSLQRENVEPSMMVTAWFMTTYASSLSLSMQCAVSGMCSS